MKLEGNRKGHITFTNNIALYYDVGGVIESFNSHVQLHGSISFVTNTANYAGGGLHSEYSHVSVEGDGRFINNSVMFVGELP